MSTRILFVHHRPEASGAARSLALLLEQLDRRFEPHVLAPGGRAAELFATAGARVHTGPVSVLTHTWDVQYGGARLGVLAREAARAPGHLRALDRLLRTLEPAIVHLNDAVMLPAGRRAHRRGVPVVWHLRTSLARGGQDRRSALIRALIDRAGAAAVAIDADVARSYDLRIPVTIVHNPVAAPGPGPVAETGIPAGRVVVGFMGYLRRQKGWPELVDAMRLLVDRGHPVHALVVGGGVRPPAWFASPRGRALSALGVAVDEEGTMRRRVAELGLDDRFSFVPFAADPGPLYRAMDVITFPNTGAGLGRPVLEAAALGIPAVASGSPDGAGVLVPGTTGILLPRPDPVALADAIASLVTDPAARHRMGAAAEAHARSAFDAATGARAVERVYDGILV